MCPPHQSPRPTPSWISVAEPILRHTRRLTPVFVRGPTLGQIQPLVHQCPSQRADIGQEHPRLAVGHLPQPPAVLPGHSHRLPPLLGKVAAVQHPHPFRLLQPGSQVPCSRPIITSSSLGESVRNRCIPRADPGTVSDRFSALRRSPDCTSRAWR